VIRVICAWCRILLVEGDLDAPASHGICPRCREKIRRKQPMIALGEGELYAECGIGSRVQRRRG